MREQDIPLAVSEKVSTHTVGAHLWLSFAICLLCNIFSGLISTLMSVYLPGLVKSLAISEEGMDLNYISAFISSLYLVGWTIGGFTWGFISDRIGRAKSIVFAVALLGAFTILTSFAYNWIMVVCFRFICGFAVGGLLVVTPTLLSEIWPPRTRSIILGIESIGFPVGIFSSGLINYFFHDWRDGFLIGLLPLTVAFLSVWLLNESAQWKRSRANPAEATREDFDKNNLWRGAIIFSSMLIGLWGMFSWIPTWVQSLLMDSDGQSQRGAAMMLLGAGGLTGGFLSGWISNYLGVRKAMLFCFLGCLVLSYLLFGVNKIFSAIIYIELAMLSVFFGISQGLLSIYIPQLFPTSVRGSATGFCFNIGRIVTAAAVFFIGALVTIFGGYGNTLLSFATIFVAGFITVFFTKDHPKSN